MVNTKDSGHCDCMGAEPNFWGQPRETCWDDLNVQMLLELGLPGSRRWDLGSAAAMLQASTTALGLGECNMGIFQYNPYILP